MSDSIRHEDGTPLPEWVKARPHNEYDRTAFKIITDPYDMAVGFVDYWFHQLFVPDYDQRKLDPVRVVGESPGRQILTPFPVYSLRVPKLEMRFLYDFWCWSVSVRSDEAVPDLFLQLFDPAKALDRHHQEGLTGDWMFGTYAENNRQFSVQFHSHHEVYVFGHVLSAVLGIRDKPLS